MIYVSPDSSLLDAFCALHGNAIRRLLVVDVRRHNPLYTVTHLLLLRFIYAKVHALAVCAFHPPSTQTHTHTPV